MTEEQGTGIVEELRRWAQDIADGFQDIVAGQPESPECRLLNEAANTIQSLIEERDRLGATVEGVRTRLLIPGVCHQDCPDVAAALVLIEALSEPTKGTP